MKNFLKKLIKGLSMNVSQFSGSGNNTVTVNGKTFNNLSGNNISITNGKVIVDGVEVEDGDFSNSHIINVTINGDCGDVTTSQGDITCGSCSSVKTSQGDIEVSGDVAGNVTTSQGDIDIDGSVSGNVKTTMGDIRYKM
jgi:hypothetical protein